eukprot:scaffold3181_cov389-Prasinococcus_capsulatus_cf.AAC.11
MGGFPLGRGLRLRGLMAPTAGPKLASWPAWIAMPREAPRAHRHHEEPLAWPRTGRRRRSEFLCDTCWGGGRAAGPRCRRRSRAPTRRPNGGRAVVGIIIIIMMSSSPRISPASG